MFSVTYIGNPAARALAVPLRSWRPGLFYARRRRRRGSRRERPRRGLRGLFSVRGREPALQSREERSLSLFLSPLLSSSFSSELTRGLTIHLSPTRGGRLVIVYLSFPRRLVFEIRLHRSRSYVHPFFRCGYGARRVWSGAYHVAEQLLPRPGPVRVSAIGGQLLGGRTGGRCPVDVLTRSLSGACARPIALTHDIRAMETW